MNALRRTEAIALAAAPMVAVAIVLGEYADTAAHWSTAVRPAAVGAGSALAIELILIGARVRPVAAAGAATAALFLVTGSRSALLGVGAVVVLLALMRLRGRDAPAPSGLATAGLAAAFLGASFLRVSVGGAITPDDFHRPHPEGASAADDSPSIYVLVLDAYARQDSLAQMGMDNEPFLGELEARGFDVYRDSRSNYEWTSSTLASMLNMRPLTAIEGLPAPGTDDREQTRALRRAINSGDALTLLRKAGYRIVSVPPIASYSALLEADDIVDTGYLNEFEVHMLQDTTLAGLLDVVAPDFIAAQHRARIETAFDVIAPHPDQATFTYAHVIAPHEPFVFDAAGQPVPLPQCFPRCWFWQPWDVRSEDVFVQGYVPQVAYVNRRVLETVDRVIADDPEAVMVVMGDHGSRGLEDDEEVFRNLMAVRSPGHPALLGRAPTPVNVLSTILNAYLGTSIETWPNAQYRGRHLDAQLVPPVQ